MVTAVPQFQSVLSIPERVLLNTRIGFKDLTSFHLDAAFWTRNLTNRKDVQFPLTYGSFLASSSFIQARTYGVDLSVRF